MHNYAILVSSECSVLSLVLFNLNIREGATSRLLLLVCCSLIYWVRGQPLKLKPQLSNRSIISLTNSLRKLNERVTKIDYNKIQHTRSHPTTLPNEGVS